MTSLRLDDSISSLRKGWSTVYYAQGVSPDAVLEALQAPGEVLKTSEKFVVRRVGNWVLKESTLARGSGPLKHTFRRKRYRQGWIAAHHLHRHGVSVPPPVAYIERGRLGIVTGNVLITGYLNGQQNVEAFLQVLIQRKAGADTIHLFLAALAQAITQFTACGAYHGDLSGKNIFTADGRRFSFIDLDDVVLGNTYDDGLRLKNHVQLYDSFCDFLSDSVLVPFISKLISTDQDIRVWMPKVREAQAMRRELVEERWANEGRTGSSG